jgi:hypothetical protein
VNVIDGSDPHGLQITHQYSHLRTLGSLGDEVEVSQEGRGGVGAGWLLMLLRQLLLVLGLELEVRLWLG